jgi:putative phage-type endonuclease
MSTKTKTRAQWIKERRKSIGASESPAIMGFGYAGQNAASVWMSKVHPTETDELAAEDRLVIGRLLEPSLRDLFQWKTGLAVHASENDTVYHQTYEYISATPDGYVFEGDEQGVLELKNVSSFFSPHWDEGVPMPYLIQIQHQLLVTGLAFGYAMALIGGQAVKIHRIERDDAFISAMLTLLVSFWDYVVRQEMPPVDDSFTTAKILRQLHPEDNGLTVDLPDSADAMIEERERLRLIKGEAEANICGIDNQLKLWIGDNTFGETPGGRKVSWKTQTRKAYEVKESTSRVLRIS